MSESNVCRSTIRSKRLDNSHGILNSRKRKLRTLYHVASSEDAIPKLPLFQYNAPPTSPAEVLFLDQNDISLGRTLTEATIPSRRLRSTTLKNKKPSHSQGDTARPLGKVVLEDAGKWKRGIGNGHEAFQSPAREYYQQTDPSRIASRASSSAATTSKLQRDLITKSSQADNISNLVIPRTKKIESLGNDASRLNNARPDGHISTAILERDHIRDTMESRPNSPGIDPQKAMPMSAEDESILPKSITTNRRDDNHKAAVVHLPPKEIQEQRLREKQLHQEAESIDEDSLRPRELGEIKVPRMVDQLSSPGSTIGPTSAATPGIHDASTDTSPDNEGPRYSSIDNDKIDPAPQTPPELKPSAEEAQLKEAHDKRLNAQMELVRNEILGSSPTAADAQLHLEEEQAAAAANTAGTPPVDADLEKVGEVVDCEVPDVAQEAPEDEDEVVGVPAPEIEAVKSPEETHTAMPREAEPMDIDSVITEDITKTEPGIPTIIPEIPQGNPSPVSGTPRRTPSSAAPTPPLERMTTRVQSGAMRHKSVSEILGETPRPLNTDKNEKAPTDELLRTQSRSATPQSPGTKARSVIDRAREKERSKLSTVIFAKQPFNRSSGKSTAVQTANNKSQVPQNADYFMPLILAQAYASTRGVQPLDSLLQAAHKTITTSNAYVPFHDHQTQKILRRIHSLQRDDKWSFRQPKRAPEPNRPTTHRDELLKEMKWMRTDFREERKWKMAVARNLAYACAEWVAADEEERKLLQVNASSPQVSQETDQFHEVKELSDDAIPDLEPSTGNDSPTDDFDEEISTSTIETIAPTAIFSLSDEDVVFGLSRSAATDKLLDELPWYGLPLQVPQSDLPTSDVDPDAYWRLPALPLSKYVEGKMVLKSDGPPRKRSRYEYEEDSDDDDQVVIGAREQKQKSIEAFDVDVALFNPENKHIRDRIQAGHQFRPPSENPMPLQSFFECRSSSHWLWAEDDELKSLVREYSYNWQLISSILSTKSMFAAGSERRTPWECFERWIHLEGLPADMQKTHYFRAYNHRLDAAQRTLSAQQQQAQQASGQTNGAQAAMTPVRRRVTTSIRVERKRNQKHLTLVDAMRKLAKKRETTMQKQAHAQNLASMRKDNNQAPHSANTVRHTPQDFSRLKHDREEAMRDRMQRLQLQQDAQRRSPQAMQQARNAPPQQNPQQYGVPNNGAQQSRVAPTSNAPGPMAHPQMHGRANQLAVPGQNLTHGPMQTLPNGLQIPIPNGHTGAPQMPMKAIPQAQMQSMQTMQTHQGQHRLPAPNPTPDVRLMAQARQMAEQQRQTVQMQQQGQQQQQPPGQSPQMQTSPPNMRPNVNGTNQQTYMQNNQAMMAGFTGQNTIAVSTPPANAFNMSNGQSGSPRVPYLNHPIQYSGGSNLQISKIETQFRANNPNATSEQVQKHVRDVIHNQRQQLSQQSAQSAMMAAAGNTANGIPNLPAGVQSDPRQYAQMLRAQQEMQSKANQAAQAAQAAQASPSSLAQSQTQAAQGSSATLAQSQTQTAQGSPATLAQPQIQTYQQSRSGSAASGANS